MVKGWVQTTVGEQATLQRGFDITKKEQELGCVPVVSSGGISSYHSEAMVDGPGVVLGRKGALGTVYFLEGAFWPHDTTLWVTDFHGNEPRFVYYFFKDKARQFLELDVGSANPTLNRNHVHPILVDWPPLNEQLAIAEVLRNLDDKIQLNRKMSRTLEEIAQTLFRAWFVDFEGETDIVNSEQGPLPRGWSVARIGELVQTVGGGTPSTKEPEYWEDGEIHWTTPRDLSGLESPVLLDTARKISEAGLEKISSGVLPEGTVLLSSRAPVGYTAIAQIPLAVNQGYIAIPPGGRLSSFYVLFWLRENLERIKGRAGGTTFQEISKKNFRPMLAIEPPKEAQERFDNIVAPLFERIVLNERQSRTLADLRDTLLPKLISGEIRVPEAEETLEEAV